MIPAWLLRPLTIRVATVALILAGLGGGKCWYDSGVRRVALAEARTAAARHALDSVVAVIAAKTAESDSLAALFRSQRDTVTRTVTRWRTLTDTLTLSDTVQVPGPVVREIVAAGDSAVRACTIALDTCAIRAAKQDTVIASQRTALALLRVQLHAAREAQPTRLETWRDRLLWGGIGFAAGWVAR